MKCPFRVITTEHTSLNGDKETIQEFTECCGEECAAAYVVEYNGISKVEECKRLMNPDCL